MTSRKYAHLIFPHQLFEATLKLDADIFVLVEDDLFFTQYRFHKQKLLLHRASMKEFEQRLKKQHKNVEYIATGKTKSMGLLKDLLASQSITQVTFYDVVDDWLIQALQKIIGALDISRETYTSPGFLTTRGEIDDYFSHNPNRMQQFYEWQRKRLDILIENKKPVGGKWSFDEQNRKPLPKTIQLPKQYELATRQSVTAAKQWVAAEFRDNPGSDDIHYPVTHEAATKWLDTFLKESFELFGPYEDAIAKNESQLFHSMLSPLLNIGLLTPEYVVTTTLSYAHENDIPIASLEGFIRQIIGWREYMRATYVRFGRSMRTQNRLGFSKKLSKKWWDGSMGLEPVDTTIKRVLDTAYAHHIERLMILGNAMILLRIDPDEVYEWFMSFFIDAYDWVMVPNVYAMSQFAAGELITTKPYISGSNYIIKMSDYKKGDWSDAWDALYWRFIHDHRDIFEKNYRSAMMVKLYDKLAPTKKQSITKLSNQWLK